LRVCLKSAYLRVERQVSVAFDFNGMHFDEGLRVSQKVGGTRRREGLGLFDEIVWGKLSREGAKGDSSMNVEKVSSVAVDTAFHLHRDFGPGLLESVYEAVLARMLEERGVRVDGCLVIELKSVEKLTPVHARQLLTYLRLLNLPVGLLINFGATTFKEGIRRVVNNHQDFASSRLRVSKKVGGTRRRHSP